jgi:serine/threonine-protein kinase
MSDRGVTEVGKYRIVEQVGEGAMGVVYRARDPVLNRTVAIKVMSDSLARDDELRGRFLREAQAAGSLQHPNVITIYDFGEVDGHLFIAMEFVVGSDLEDLLRNNAPLTVVQKIDLLIDILGGLAYAHKRGVVHRDVKPANIRVDEEGRARIMDFGIARLQSSTITRTGLMVGTPAYMAPEQVGGGVVSPQTDIFSAGAVMYELFTGRKPFEGETLQSVFYKIVSQSPPDFTSVAPRLPAALNSIVMRALAKDPGERYSTATEMASDLAEVRANVDREASQPRGSLNASITTGLLATRATKPIAAPRPRSHFAIGGVAAVVLLVASAGIYMKMHTVAVSPALATSTPTPAPAPEATQAAATPPAPVPVPAAPAVTTTKSEPAKKETNALNAQELELFKSLQSTAAEMRTRAIDAGASAQSLRSGDDHNAAANASALKGKVTEAANHLKLASGAWAVAERDARAATAAAAAAAANTKRAEAPKVDPVVPAPIVTSPASQQQPPSVTPPPKPVVLPPANPATEIDAVMKNYERAIDSRDIAELKRAYPGMTATQSKGWEDFLRTLRSIHATLAVSGLTVNGDAADARITGSYDYISNSGQATKQAANFQASFKRENGVWKLAAVR